MAEKVEIYGLFDPDTDALRYVGKANDSQQRLKTHLWDSPRSNRPVCRWIAGLLKDGKAPVMRVLEVCKPDEWEEAEKRLIEAHRKVAKLLNLADGGARPSQTIEQRRKAGKASIAAQKLDPKMRAFNKAKMDMGRLYKQLCKKPDWSAYMLRLTMKCYAAADPDLHKSWVNLP